ncbi:MAG: gliding motility-associated C-terminal domain-containing protein [Bacteroidetes bacterium]|nr:gliding motility-associated C-terminal domain-containing protein [Bacteroidota bacterium]
MLNKKTYLLVLLLIVGINSSWSQDTACDFKLNNPDFETPDINTMFGSTTWKTFDEGLTKGWQTTASDNKMEYWRSGYQGVPAYSGNQFAELNANMVSALYQDASTIPGTTLKYGFAHRGRAGVDVMELQIGPPGGPYITQGQYSTGKNAWVFYTGNYLVPAGQTITRLQFVSVSSAGGNKAVGNFLDAIDIQSVNVSMSLTTSSYCGGTIDVHSSAPATVKLEYSLDNITYQNDSFFNNLNPGNYTVYMRIGEICTQSKTITVAPNTITNTVSASTASATCTGLVANNNGSILISPTSISDADQWRFDYSAGSSYNGNKTYATGIPVGASYTISNLPNPTVSTNYTLRFFSIFGCTIDTTVALNPANCFCSPEQAKIKSFPADTSFSTGYKTAAGFDQRWKVSDIIYKGETLKNIADLPSPNASYIKYSAAKIQNNCAPSVWVHPENLPAPFDKAHWITGTNKLCASEQEKYVYRFYRNTFELPCNCNSTAHYTEKQIEINLDAYGDNQIIALYVNGKLIPAPYLPSSNVTFIAGNQAKLKFAGEWKAGENTIEILMLNGVASTVHAAVEGLLVTGNNSIPVLSNPTADAGADIAQCASVDSIDLTDAVNTQKWITASGPKNIVINGKTGKANQLGIAGDYYFVLLPDSTDLSGCADTMKVTVYPQPVFNLGADKTICADAAKITFDAGKNFSSYLWSTGEKTKTISTATTGKYSLTVTDVNSCSTSDTVNLNVNPLPVFDLGADKAICADAPKITFDAGKTFNSYLWSSGEKTKTISTATAGKYTLTVTDANSCSSSDNVNLIVNPLPVFDLGADKAICADAAKITFDAGKNFSSYLWNSGEKTKTISTATAGKYILTATDVNSCSSSDTVNLIVNPLPVFDLGADKAICADGASVTFDAGSSFATYAWSNGEKTKSIITHDAGVYTLVVSDSAGCSSSDTVELVVNALPEINIGPDMSMCEGQEPVVFSVPMLPQYSYAWSTGETSNSISVSKKGWYILRVTSNKNCVKIDSVWLEVKDLPNINLGPDVVICETELPVLLNAGADMDAYSWSTTETSQKIKINSSGLYEVTVVKNGCEKKSEIDVLVDYVPKVSLKDEYILCEGESVDMTVITSAPIVFWSTNDTAKTIQVNSKGKYSVSVSTGIACTANTSTNVVEVPHPKEIEQEGILHCFREVNVVELDATTDANKYLWFDGSTSPIYYAEKEGVYNVQLISSYGCITYDSIYVDELCTPVLYVPNAFTPNNDGKNDAFFAQSSDDLLEYDLKIFDRWGELLFETNDINDGWDGIYRGNLAQIDVYVWKIDYKFKSMHGAKRDVMYGHVSLIK